MQSIMQIQTAALSIPSLDATTRNNINAQLYLEKLGLISFHQLCPKCQIMMMKHNDNDHYIRKNTFLQKHDRINLMILTRIIFIYFCQGMNAKKVSLELPQIYNEHGKIGFSTVKRVYANLRIKLEEYYRILWRLTKLPIGDIYEMDETILTRKPKKQGEATGVGISIIPQERGFYCCQ